MEYLNNLNFANKLFQTFTSMQNRIGKRLIFLLLKASNISVLSVATPTITEENSAISYEIAGTSITLTCTSTSGSGTYAWKFDGTALRPEIRWNRNVCHINNFTLHKSKCHESTT